MNIELSAKEYRDLLDILHIADVVLSGHRKEEDRRSERHRALIQKLYALARKEGFDRLINYTESEKKYFPTEEFEDNSLAHAVIDEFGSHLFWHELISRMTERDAERIAGGPERLHAMGDGERQIIESPIRHRYVEEFAANEVANLEVIPRFVMRAGSTLKTSD
jgi:hypothetical protein